MKLLRGLFGIALVILGIWAFWTIAQGLTSGEIVQFSKHGNAILHRDLNADRYWIAIVFWTIAAVMLVGGGIKMAKDNFKKD